MRAGVWLLGIPLVLLIVIGVVLSRHHGWAM